MADPTSLPAWIYTAVSGVVGAAVSGGVVAGRYGEKIKGIEKRLDGIEERIENRLDLMHADIRSISETLAREP